MGKEGVPLERTLTVLIQAQDQKKKFSARLRSISKREAGIKALKIYLASLVLAFGCGFIPIVHFIAVPGLLVLGPVVAMTIYRFFCGQQDLVMESVFCMNCEKPLKLSRAMEAWPLKLTCPHCGKEHRAEIVDS